MMENFKYTPIELGKMIPEELYNKIDGKQKFALVTKRKIREAALAQIMLELNKSHIFSALRNYKNWFILKRRAFLY